MLLMLLGGVGVQQVIQAVLVAAATSLAAGSLGGLVGCGATAPFSRWR